MKEIFLNAARCAYSAELQDSILECTGTSASKFKFHYFHSKEHNMFDPIFEILSKSLNMSSIQEGVHVYHTDAYGRRYEDNMLSDVFAVKHSDDWYESFWSCVTEGKDGVEALLEEAVKDYEELREKINKIKEMILQF